MRNLNKPPRYNVASIQAQQTLGGDVMQSDENGQYVEFRDYAWLLAEKQRLDSEVDAMTTINSTLTLRNNSLVDMLDGCEKEFEALDNEIASLKSEVERLNTGIQPAGSNDAVGRAVNVLLEKEKEIARLKSEVERLKEGKQS